MLTVQQDEACYVEILKSVIRNQIQHLIKQLQDEAGEETLVLSASVKEGTLSHLGSSKALDFLQSRRDMKTQFFDYCVHGPRGESTVSTEGFSTDTAHVTHFGGYPLREETGSLLNWLEKSTPEKSVRRKHSASPTPGTEDVLADRENSPTEKVYTDLQNVKAIRISPTIDNVTTVNELSDDRALGQDHGAFSSNVFNIGMLQQNGINTQVPELDLSNNIGLISVPQTGFYFPQSSSDLQQTCKQYPASVTHPSKEMVNISQLLSIQCVPSTHTTQPTVTVTSQHEKPLVSGATEVHVVSSGEANLTRRTHRLEIPPSLKPVLCEKQKPVPTTQDITVDIFPNGQNKKSQKYKSLLQVSKKPQALENREKTLSVGKTNAGEFIVENSGKVNCTSEPQLSLVNLPTVLISNGNIKSTDYSKSVINVIDPPTSTAPINSKPTVMDGKERDKSKKGLKNLSSKIKEITERIKKDETRQNPDHNIEDLADTEPAFNVETRDKPMETVAMETVSMETGTVDEISGQNQDTEASKLKDVSRASHRKPKLPRFNIGVASDDEDNGEPQKLGNKLDRKPSEECREEGKKMKLQDDHGGKGENSNFSSNGTAVENDILNINVTIDDSDSSFAHFNLDELGESILLNDSITDIVTGEDSNRSLLETVLSVKPKKVRDPSTKKPLTSQSVVVSGSKQEKHWVKCRLCPEKFSNIEGLEDHLQTAIHVIKKFQCDLCGRKFAALRDVERHRRIHTGEKPFTCEICNKAFSRKDNLKSHKRQHFKNTQAKSEK